MAANDNFKTDFNKKCHLNEHFETKIFEKATKIMKINNQTT